jgi:sec-independent protein translocase protein TatB
MFGLSIEHLLILLVAGLFIFGPERLPEAAAWLGRTVRKVREFATGAQQQLRAEVGPELDELRKPLQDLQDLRALREFDPRTMVGRYLLDDLGPTPVGDHNSRPPAPSHPVEPLPPGQRPPVDPDAT